MSNKDRRLYSFRNLTSQTLTKSPKKSSLSIRKNKLSAITKSYRSWTNKSYYLKWFRSLALKLAYLAARAILSFHTLNSNFKNLTRPLTKLRKIFKIKGWLHFLFPFNSIKLRKWYKTTIWRLLMEFSLSLMS